MIVRATGDNLLLITQPDHAALATVLMTAWRRDGFEIAPRRDTILMAIREHDNGWQEEDRVPLLDPATGRILDFVGAPVAVRQRVWPRAVDRLRQHPYAAALVAEHALTVLERYREHPAWVDWFAQMEDARAAALKAAAPLTYEDLRRDYFFVGIGDLASLTFCNGWTARQVAGEYQLMLNARTSLAIQPDPFDGAEVPVTIRGKQLSNRQLASTAELSAAYESAPIVTLTGIAVGVSRSRSLSRS